jgi:Rrf2 family nitric oxide-sensitive transcriptional repressor
VRLTTFTDYSLRVLIHVAVHRDHEPATIAQIADAFGISENHLTKVVHFLGKEGFLATSRGRGGGLRLARPASAINLAAVVRRAEGEAMPAECFDPATNHCAITRMCRLRGVLKEAVDAFYAVLARYTLEDLVANRNRLAQVLFVESVARG